MGAKWSTTNWPRFLKVMLLTPWLVAALPLIDLADPPPRAVPPKPIGASRLTLGTGIGLTDDIGLEFDIGLMGTGYLVAWPDQRTETASTLWTQVQATHYMPADSEMMASRYWTGPFIRGSIGTELYGRHGWAPGSLKRADFSVGLRSDAHPGITGALGLGWAVVRDSPVPAWHQGMQFFLELMWR
jgi:hypothetical protein